MLPGTSPEVVYNKLAPEVVESGVAIAELEGFVRDKAKYPKWMKWVTGALVFGVVTALAIGLAFEYQKESKTSTSLPAKAKFVKPLLDALHLLTEQTRQPCRNHQIDPYNT